MKWIVCVVISLWWASAIAHHVLGRPSYHLSEDETTPPGTQMEAIVGKYQATFMTYPAFPKPGESGRFNLHIASLDGLQTFQGQVTFSIRENSWFGGHWETLGKQSLDDQVYRQRFAINNTGNYLVRATFHDQGKPHTVDFPIRIGEPPMVGPVGISIGLIFVALIAVNLYNRKRMGRLQISRQHRNSHADT